MYWHQFQRGDVERFEVLNDHRVGQPGIGTPQFFGDAGMGPRHALDMGLIDDRLVIRRQRCPVESPVEERIDHHAGHRVAERVDHRGSTGFARVAVRVNAVQVIGEQRLPEGEVAVERLPVRVEQQLAGVTAVAGGRVERPVHPESVALARGDVRQIRVPDVAVHLVERDSRLAAVLRDQAQLHLVGHFGEQRKVGASTVIGGAERIGGARPDGSQRRCSGS